MFFFVGVEYCLEYLRSEFEVGALFCKGSIYVGGVEGSEFVASSVLAAQLRDGLNPGPDSFQTFLKKASMRFFPCRDLHVSCFMTRDAFRILAWMILAHN